MMGDRMMAIAYLIVFSALAFMIVCVGLYTLRYGHLI